MRVDPRIEQIDDLRVLLLSEMIAGATDDGLLIWRRGNVKENTGHFERKNGRCFAD
jgi:hypothetical protein